MNNKTFVLTLKNAIKGDKLSLDAIINEYEKLIIKYSVINGKVDEDCMSEIKLRIIASIKKFRGL